MVKALFCCLFLLPFTHAGVVEVLPCYRDGETVTPDQVRINDCKGELCVKRIGDLFHIEMDFKSSKFFCLNSFNCLLTVFFDIVSKTRTPTKSIATAMWNGRSTLRYLVWTTTVATACRLRVH